MADRIIHLDDDEVVVSKKDNSGTRIKEILRALEDEISKRALPEPEPLIIEPVPLDGMDQLKAFFSGEEGLKRSDAFLKFASLLTEPKEEPKCVVEEVVEEPEHEDTREAIKIIKSLNSPYFGQKKSV